MGWGEEDRSSDYTSKMNGAIKSMFPCVIALLYVKKVYLSSFRFTRNSSSYILKYSRNLLKSVSNHFKSSRTMLKLSPL